MLPSIDLRLNNLIKALNEVVIPALPARESLARDQAMLVVGHLQIIAKQWKFALDFEAKSLDALIALAETLCTTEAGRLGKALLEELTEEIAKARTADRKSHADIENAVQTLGKLVDRVILAEDCTGPLPESLTAAVLNYGTRQAWRERIWFQDNKLDPDSAELPSFESILT